MASEKNSKNKKTATKSKKAGASASHKPSGVNFEIVAICIIAISIYLMVCTYTGGESGGFVGKALHGGMLGIFGTGAYIFAPLIIVSLLYAIFKKNDEKLKSRMICIYVAFLDLICLFQMSSPGMPFNKWFSYAMSGNLSGGFVGGAVTAALTGIAGEVGAYIILICTLLALMITIFNISIASIFSAIYSYFKSMMETADATEKPKKTNRQPKEEKRNGVVITPDIDGNSGVEQYNDEEIVINVTDNKEEDLPDPEISVYDEFTSGPEDEEPSEEEKAIKKLSDDEKENIDREIKEEIGQSEEKREPIKYDYPSLELLSKPPVPVNSGNVQEELRHNAQQLIETLRSFKVDARVVEISQGPTITRYEIEPAEGVRVNQITNLSKDIGLKFKADKGVMVAPVPGKSTIGIEIENKNPSVVALREVIESEEFKNHKSKLAVALGKDVSGKPIIMDLAKMPHLLIAGATGAGKSVCINTLVISLLYKADPNEVKLVMVDPKQVELGVYNGIPHLLIPVVKDAKKATGALSWAVQEMTERYSVFERNNVRNIQGYNALMEKNGTPEGKMASIVILIDEFADLMMVAPADVENYVCRIAQLARAAGMHLVIATQRPVVKFITGNIKANVPSRISFMVASVRDSQTILDIGGAEKLIGKGDMLYMPVGETSPSRMQCAFVSDDDVKAVVESITNGVEAFYDPDVIEQLEKDEGEYQADGEDPGDADPLLADAIDMAITGGQISTSLLQRRFRIGYNRAGSIIDQMEQRGIISGLDGNKPRQVLISREQYNEMLMK